MVTCRRCIKRAQGASYTAPHTRKKGCLMRGIPHRSPSRPWTAAIRAGAAAKNKVKAKARLQTTDLDNELQTCKDLTDKIVRARTVGSATISSIKANEPWL